MVVHLALPALYGQTDSIQVGFGAPNQFIQQRFVAAYSREGFNSLVSLPPVTPVQKIGAAGLIQLFQDAVGTEGVRHALVKADANAGLTYDENGQVSGGDVYQLLAPMFAVVASANGGTVLALANFNVTGFPATDTAIGMCGSAACYYQSFDKNYTIFAILGGVSGSLSGQLKIKGGFNTQWAAGGGFSTYGFPTSDEAEITSAITGTKADWQQFSSGYIFRFNGGTVNERYIAVPGPIADFYKELGGPAGQLGLPLEVVRTMPDGRFRQSFEGGAVEYVSGQRPVLLLPVHQVFIEGASTSGTIRLRRGETVEVRARLIDAQGNELTGRTVNWTTSNSRIVSIEAAGARATLKAVGAGVATVLAISEGRRSTPVTISVASQCCEPGEGAPTPTISQAIQETIRRNRLTVRLPTGAPVQRMGAGHYQEFQDAATGAPYLIAVPDPGSTGFLVKGEILGRLVSLGGLTGPLGYPSSEETAGGRQMFSGRYALAGRPVRLVQSPLIEKWAAFLYEAGPLGSPTSDAGQTTTFSGSPAVYQSFTGGMLAGSTVEAQPYSIRPPFVERYLSLNGVLGDLGLPTSEEVVADGTRRQTFEGGLLTQPAGGEIAVTLEPRKPRVLITPNPVTAGSTVRIAAGGFPSGTPLEIRAGADAAFNAVAVNGAFAWETPVPSTAAGAAVRVEAAGPDGLRAEGSYRIRSIAEAEPKLVKLSGDLQTGPPGALLPMPLRVVLRDGQGAPLSGVDVSFQPAPGTVLERSDSKTNASGEAMAWMRLPDAEGVALATAAAARQVVTFRAQAANTILASFPAMTQDFGQLLGNSSATLREQGALVASAANIIRFYQDRGLLPAPNGLADPLTLSVFLKDYCPFALDGRPFCDGFLTPAGGDAPAANLARIPAFAGGGSIFEFGEPKFETIRDWLAEGGPVLVALRMTAGSQPAGMHYVVARGVAANGGLLAFDPSSHFGRASVNDFLSDFTLGGRVWRGSIASVARLQLRAAGPNYHYVHSSAPFQIAAEQGACSGVQSWLDRAATPASTGMAQPWWFAICDAPAVNYQAIVDSPGASSIHGASGGAQPGAATIRAQGPAAFRIQTDPAWKLIPQRVEVDRGSAPVNAANLQPQLAPGSLMSVFGYGFLAPDKRISVELAGIPLPPVSVSPFRVTAWLPPDLAPGRHPARIQTPLGTAEFEVEVLPAAPAIFQDSTGIGLVTDAAGRMITRTEPARRGAEILVYATGLGELDGPQARAPVSAEIDGRPVAVASVEWVVEQTGVYRVRVAIPSTQAPGSAVRLALIQRGVSSLPVQIAVQ
jgi:uncharacterized protein (TIGR03437 family)